MPLKSKVTVSGVYQGGKDVGYGSFDKKTLPPPSLEIEGNTKIVTSYKYEDGKKYKVIDHYKIERIKMSEEASTRRQWKKYGKAIDDPPGPNSLNSSGAGPSSINLDSLRGAGDSKKGGLGGRYIPPSLREGGNKRGDFLVNSKSKDEVKTILVTNLPEEIQDGDIKDLFHQFGKIVRISLPKDKYTGQSKGFASVRFDRNEDATKAVKHINGFGYANLILNVELAFDANRKSKVNELIQLKNYSQFYGQRYARSSVEVSLRSQDLKKLAQKMRTRDKKRLKDPSLKSFEGSKKTSLELIFLENLRTKTF